MINDDARIMGYNPTVCAPIVVWGLGCFLGVLRLRWLSVDRRPPVCTMRRPDWMTFEVGRIVSRKNYKNMNQNKSIAELPSVFAAPEYYS
jgi:hypothetical protein